MDDLNLSISCSFQLVLAEAQISTTILDHASQIIRRALSEPIAASCLACHQPHPFEIAVNGSHESSTQKWTVEMDNSAVPSEDDVSSAGSGVVFHGIKITTPLFHTSTTHSTSSGVDGHVHQLDYRGTVAAVLRHLTRSIGHYSSQFWLYAPSTCRMSVQVHNDDLGFYDSVYSRVSQLTQICARQIDFLHFGKSFTDSTAPSDSKAILFNQAPSTLDPTTALAWIDVCICMVTYCAGAEQSFFDWQLSSQGEYGSPTFTASDLIYAIGTEQSTKAYYEDPRGSRYDDTVVEAMLLASSVSRLGPLALHVANKELKEADPSRVLANVKVKLIDGEYGDFSDGYMKMALVAMNTS